MNHVISPTIQGSTRSFLTGAIAAAVSLLIAPPIAAQLLDQTHWIVGGASSGANFGTSVAISGDTMIAGAPNEDGIGSAYVYVRPEGIWTRQQKLTPEDGQVGDRFGYAVAIDGNTVVVGAPQRNRG